jgi:hypothetical protein
VYVGCWSLESAGWGGVGEALFPASWRQAPTGAPERRVRLTVGRCRGGEAVAQAACCSRCCPGARVPQGGQGRDRDQHGVAAERGAPLRYAQRGVAEGMVQGERVRCVHVGQHWGSTQKPGAPLPLPPFYVRPKAPRSNVVVLKS